MRKILKKSLLLLMTICCFAFTFGAIRLESNATVAEVCTGEKILIEDNCSDFSKVDKLRSSMETLRIEKERIGRSHDTEDSQGPMGTDSSREKYLPSEVVYKAYGDIKRFELDTILYFWEAGYEEAVKPESKKYFFYEVEVHASKDGEDWQLIPCDYSVSEPKDQGAFPSDEWACITYFNKNDLPLGMRFIKIYLIGQVGLCDEGGAVFGYENEENLSSDPWYTFNNIHTYYNSWAPFVERVGIYADENATIDVAVNALKIDNINKTLRMGESFLLKASRTLSTDPIYKEIEDYSDYQIILREGAEYVNVNDSTGEITVVDGYAVKNGKVVLYLEKDGVFTDDFTLSLILPVDSVSISARTTVIRIGSDYVPIEISILPLDATNTSIEWCYTDADGNEVESALEITGEGMLKGLKAGRYVVKGTVDGKVSNEISFTVEERTKAVIKGEFMLRVGDKVNLILEITPDSAKTLPVSWSIVENDGIAVIENGVLKAKKIGVCTLRATVDGQTVETYVEIWGKDKESTGCSSSIKYTLTGLLTFVGATFVASKKRKNKDG